MKIGVYGSAAGDISQDVLEKAGSIGRCIAEEGHVLVTGACHGLPQEAVKSAHSAGGLCVGFSPAISLEQHEAEGYPIKEFSELIFVPKDYEYKEDKFVCKKYRNVSSVAAVDAAIIIGGRTGSMNEFTNAYDMGKVVGVLSGSGGITNRVLKVLLEDIDKESSGQVIFESNPEVLVKKVIAEFS